MSSLIVSRGFYLYSATIAQSKYFMIFKNPFCSVHPEFAPLYDLVWLYFEFIDHFLQFLWHYCALDARLDGMQ